MSIKWGLPLGEDPITYLSARFLDAVTGGEVPAARIDRPPPRPPDPQATGAVFISTLGPPGFHSIGHICNAERCYHDYLLHLDLPQGHVVYRLTDFVPGRCGGTWKGRWPD